MSDKEDLKNRADKMSGGDEIGGTTFGQTPGEADEQKQRRREEAETGDAPRADTKSDRSAH